jgi:bile acid-coenzyme A ligase
VPDDSGSDLGQVPYALVQTRGDLDETTLREFLAGRLSGYKVPRTIEFVDRPLRDDAGKARRSAVRDEVIARLKA